MAVFGLDRFSKVSNTFENVNLQKCGTLRGELDSSTPRVFGVFWMVVVDG